MTDQTVVAGADRSWLKGYYAVRALFSVAWVALAFTVGKSQPSIGIGLLLIYPAWDCLANGYDAIRSGGFRSNPSQLINVVVSGIVTFAIAIAAPHDFHAAIGIVGLWA